MIKAPARRRAVVMRQLAWRRRQGGLILSAAGALILLIGGLASWQSQNYPQAAKVAASHVDDNAPPTLPVFDHPPTATEVAALTPHVSPITPEKQNLPQVDGLAPVIYKIDTTQPVVFLTIDDGWVKDKLASEWLRNRQIPATLFLLDDAVKDNYAYFQQLQSAGMTIEDHTFHHPQLPKLSLAGQKAEICGAADKYATVFGRRPTLLRPPYGAYNNLTRQAAKTCDLKAVVLWDVVVTNGNLAYLKDVNNLRPGDIVLMHFRPEFVRDADAFLAQVKKANLQIGKLEDWLQ